MLQLHHGAYTISDDRARIDVDAVHRYLSQESYWAAGRPREIVARSIANALCLAAYAQDGSLAGFAKVITDYAVSAHLNDVFVLAAHRGKGLGEALVAAALNHPDLSTVHGWSLRTRDAHGLYARFGFVVETNPANAMRRMTPAADFPVSPVDAPGTCA